MSKSEMVKRSAQEQAKPLQQQARSTADAQWQLIQRLDQLAQDQIALTEEQRTAARTLATGLKAIHDQGAGAMKAASENVEKVLGRAMIAVERAETTLTATDKAVKSSSATIRKAADAMGEQAARMRWTALGAAAACGLMTGVLLLTALLIWQPGLIQALWKIAQAIR